VRHGHPAGAQEHGPDIIGGGPHGGVHAGRVAGNQDHHGRQAAHQRQVFNPHLGWAVLAQGDPAVAAQDLGVEIGHGNCQADLVIGVAQQERREAGDPGDKSTAGQAGAHPHQVALGDAEVEKAVGKGLADVFRLG
jgi:hypothetical protein